MPSWFCLEGGLVSQPGSFGLATAPVTALKVPSSSEGGGMRATVDPEVRSAAEEVLQQRIVRLLPDEWKTYIRQLASRSEALGQAQGATLSKGDEADGGKDLSSMPSQEFSFVLAQWLASTGIVGSQVMLSWMAQGTTLDLLGKLNTFLTELGSNNPSQTSSVEK